MKGTNIKCLWGTANMFGNPRYMNGAGSSNSADVFCFAAAQVKRALDITVKLGGRGYVFWGGREGYETLLNTDVKFEQENIAALMHMAVDYDRSIGFTGDFVTTMAMYEILKAGGLTGGLNSDSKNRRPSYTHEDMFHAFILGMDAFALGLIKAAKIIEDGRIDKFVEDR